MAKIGPALLICRFAAPFFVETHTDDLFFLPPHSDCDYRVSFALGGRTLSLSAMNGRFSMEQNFAGICMKRPLLFPPPHDGVKSWIKSPLKRHGTTTRVDDIRSIVAVEAAARIRFFCGGLWLSPLAVPMARHCPIPRRCQATGGISAVALAKWGEGGRGRGAGGFRLFSGCLQTK